MGNRKKNPLDAEYTSGGIFNSKKLSTLKQLRRQGIYRNPKTVFRVMQKFNLLSVVRRRKFHYCSQHLHRYPNLLNREFTAERPNQKWVTDISYIKTAQGFLYLSIIRDLYDNSIVAYKMDEEQSVKLVLDTIKVAKRKITTEL